MANPPTFHLSELSSANCLDLKVCSFFVLFLSSCLSLLVVLSCFLVRSCFLCFVCVLFDSFG